MPFIPDEQQSTEQLEQPKKSLLSSFADTGKEVISRAFNLPSQMSGGILKSGREMNEGIYKSPETGIKVPKWLGGKSGQYDVGKLIAPPIVGAFRGVKEKPSVMKELPKYVGVDPETPTGFGIGLAGEVVTPDIGDVALAGKVGSKLMKSFGSKFTKAGETLAEAGIKPTKTQRESFFQAAKKTIGKYVADNKLAGNLAENLANKLDTLQNEFDDIAIRSGKMANKADIQTAIEESISSLNKVVDEGEIKALEEFREKLTNLGDEIDIADLTAMRKRLDAKIPKAQWQKLLGGKSVSKMVEQRMALQRIIQNISSDVISPSGKSLKELGQELMPLYKLSDIVGLQEGVSVAGRIGGVGDIAAFGGGFVMGDGSFEDRLKNALTVGIGRRVVTNPRVLSEAASGAIKTGEALSKPGVIQTFAKEGLRVGKDALLSPFRKKEDQYTPPTPGFIPD